MQPNTRTRWEYKAKFYVKNVRKKSCRFHITAPAPSPPLGIENLSIVVEKKANPHSLTIVNQSLPV